MTSSATTMFGIRRSDDRCRTRSKPGGVIARNTVILLVCALLLLGDWVFFDVAAWWGACIVSLSVALTTARRRLRLAFAAVCCTCLILAVVNSRKFFPMTTSVAGGRFAGVPLADVLLHFAEQRDDRPRWRFCIYGEELAVRRIRVRIADQTTLGSALEEVFNRSGCEWSWHWRSMTNHQMQPTSLTVYVWQEGTDRDTAGRRRIWVQRDGIIKGLKTAKDQKASRNPRSSGLETETVIATKCGERGTVTYLFLTPINGRASRPGKGDPEKVTATKSDAFANTGQEWETVTATKCGGPGNTGHESGWRR